MNKVDKKRALLHLVLRNNDLNVDCTNYILKCNTDRVINFSIMAMKQTLI